MSTVNPSVRTFWAQKAGNSEDEYEDAFSVAPNVIAIADGATESSFARLWAQALVSGATSKDYPESEDVSLLEEWAKPLQREWTSQVPWDRLPWFAEEKTRQGAFSTLLVLRFAPGAETVHQTEVENCPDIATEQNTAWRAMAIGDSCLVHIRSEAILVSFPVEKAADFDSRPLLMSTNPTNNGSVWDNVSTLQGHIAAGDTLFLMTDALAKWFLAEAEVCNRPWQELLGLTGQEDFLAKITSLRENHAMRNDDVTLVIIQDHSDPLQIEPAQPVHAHILEPFE